MSRYTAVLPLVLAACSFQGGSAFPGGDLDGDPNPPSDSGADPAVPFPECAGADPSDQVFDEDIICLSPLDDPTAGPLVVLEHAVEDYNGVEAIHVRLSFNPTFADNTYGTGSVGWDRPRKFDALVGSDHARLFLSDAAGEVVFDLDLDYISEDATAPCGYASLGPFGGDGEVRAGDEAAILDWTTSIDRNLNERGYCETVDSPETTSLCEPPANAPDWDFRVVYELWVAASAFEPAGFGRGDMESVHASPAKGENTVVVTEVECPTDGTDGCLDPDGCPDPGGECPSECPTGSYCESGACVPVVD